ncbi:MAG: hypothetical protein R3D78_06700 [Paracoccaceae bacterium]
MCAITGPYAQEIFEPAGGGAGSVVHEQLLPDFGGMHPDPNLTWAHELMAEMMAKARPISARPRMAMARSQHDPWPRAAMFRSSDSLER